MASAKAQEFIYYTHSAGLYAASFQSVKYFCRRHAAICARYIAIAMALLPISLRAETPPCPADHHALGKPPPAGTEWRCIDQNGVADGPWLTWYDNGQLMSERQMKHGKEHGRQRSWWPNGQLMMEGISYEGNRYKGFKYWSINGEPTELQLKTETVTKKIDDNTSAPMEESIPPAKSTQGAK